MKTPTPCAISAALRQLQQARQPAEALYPELALLLRELVPHAMFSVLAFSDEGTVADTYWPQRYPFPLALVDAGRRLYECLTHQSDFAGRLALGTLAQRRQSTDALPHEHWVALAVRRDGRLTHAVLLAREGVRWGFSDREMRLLNEVAPALIELMTTQTVASNGAGMGYPADTAFAVAGTRAELLYGSPDAWGMLHRAAGLPITAADHAGVPPDRLRAFIDRLQQWRADGAADESCVHEFRNRYGSFVCRVHEVGAPGDEGYRHAVIQIERRVSLIQHLFRSERFRTLTARERDVCALLLDDKTYGEIATILGIRQNSVVFHVRNLYGALGVDQRSQLWAALQEPTRVERTVRALESRPPMPVVRRASQRNHEMGVRHPVCL